MSIPKIIHYCWLSDDPFPELIQKCVDSWKEKLPDYEIVKWDTKRFDVNICDYTREAYENKKYAFVSDYVRLYALYNMGGIYLDSDIEVIKNFDELLNNDAFTGFENDHTVAAWIFGSVAGNPIYAELLKYYDGRHFVKDDGSFDYTPNCVPVTQTLIEHGLLLNGNTQKLDKISIYATDFFCPYSRATEELNITDNTYTIHYFNSAWIPEEKRKIIIGRKRVVEKFGKGIGYIYYGIMVLLKMGIRQFASEFKFFIRK